MKKRYIAITQRLYTNEGYHEVREALASDWGSFFARYLGDFCMLPLSYKQDIEPYLSDIAGIILSGGNDLSVCNDSMLNRERDSFEKKIIELCMQDSIPLLGICRGAQMIAHYFHSTIVPCKNHVGVHAVVQDRSALAKGESQNDGSMLDSRKTTKNAYRVSESSITFHTNSFHNYAIETLGSELLELARSKGDSISPSIEALKHKQYRIFGIMWHVEREGGMENSEIFRLWKQAVIAYSTQKEEV